MCNIHNMIYVYNNVRERSHYSKRGAKDIICINGITRGTRKPAGQ